MKQTTIFSVSPVLTVILTLALLASHAQAQTVQPPEPVNAQGRYMLGYGVEGIVRVRYTVKKDGTVDDVEIIDYLSNQFLNTMLEDTVSAWTFTPGLVDGEPADFLNQEWLFALRVDPNEPATPPAAFQRGGRGAQEEETEPSPPPTMTQQQLPLALSQEIKDYILEIYDLIAAGDMDEAQKQVNRLIRRDFLTVFDYGLANELRANILMTQNALFEALESSILATMTYEGPQGDARYFLTDDSLEVALKRKFFLALSVRQNKLAWDSYQELLAKFDLSEDDQVHEQAQQAKALIDSSEPLQLIAKIVDNQWSYKPARRIFTVTNVDGRLTEIEARCEHRNLELKYQENVDWSLPDALGECVLDFKGRDGTQFVVYEFAE